MSVIRAIAAAAILGLPRGKSGFFADKIPTCRAIEVTPFRGSAEMIVRIGQKKFAMPMNVNHQGFVAGKFGTVCTAHEEFFHLARATTTKTHSKIL